VKTLYTDCPLDIVYDFVVENHYTHTCPRAGIVSHSFGAINPETEKIVGAAVIGHKAGNAKTGGIFHDAEPTKCRELIRLVLSDDAPTNSESNFLGFVLRWMRKNTDIQGLLSYADPEHGHTGVVYRATNWLYTGLSGSSRKLIINGEEISARRASNLYGTCSAVALREMGMDVAVRHTAQKHRFIYVLDKALMPFVKYPILKFGVAIIIAVIAWLRAKFREFTTVVGVK
jgi:hypothetical protein